jgi:hypothetical protein
VAPPSEGSPWYGPGDLNDAGTLTPSSSPPPPSPAQAEFVLTIGDIGITGDHRVVTPNGVAPLAGSMWLRTRHVSD